MYNFYLYAPNFQEINQGKRMKLLTLMNENDTILHVRGRRFSDREKMFAQVVGHIVNRLVYLFK
jgi:hypothetical protein